jgi:hypothetical protein
MHKQLSRRERLTALHTVRTQALNRRREIGNPQRQEQKPLSAILREA